MPAAYSADIRGRVIASVESGSSRRETVPPIVSARWPVASANAIFCEV
jgi:hypothetical protein